MKTFDSLESSYRFLVVQAALEFGITTLPRLAGRNGIDEITDVTLMDFGAHLSVVSTFAMATAAHGVYAMCGFYVPVQPEQICLSVPAPSVQPDSGDSAPG